MVNDLVKATLDTMYMVMISGLSSLLLGMPLGIILYLTREGGLRENKTLYSVLDFLVNIFRSVPFIILLIILRPLSYLLINKTIGPDAAAITLSAAAIPFMARLLEGTFLKVDRGIIESAVAMGSKIHQIIFKVLIVESLPNITKDITMTLVNLIGYSAMAGSIGGGGLGNLAIRYGVQNYKFDYLLYCLIIIIIMVQTIEIIGNFVYINIKR